jgi:hypothetical protein
VLANAQGSASGHQMLSATPFHNLPLQSSVVY